MSASSELDRRIGGIAALDQPLRRDLYRVLVAADGRTGRDEAATALGVPRSVAAFHLDKLVDAPAWERLWPVAEAALRARGIEPSLPPHAHPLGHEWALDSGAEAHVTVAPVDGPVEAARTAVAETSGLAACVCATDEAAATAFLDAYTGTGAFWNTTTRLLDGYKLLGLPETGINVDHTPGPRGPVTYVDLALRQFVVLPPAD